MKRGDKNMEIRLDSRAESAEAIRQLGIEIGDFIFLDVRLEVNDEGFIRARHLDDKAGLAAILGALAALQEAGLQPAQDTTLLISNYEEIGHGGGTGWPDNLAELLVIDMAAIGEGQHSDIYSVNICAKDNSSVYHLDMLDRLRRLAKEHHIPAKLDLYPHYGSDGGAYWRTGGTAKVALIGPGVEASHAYERTHQDSLHDTAHLIACYLVDDTP
jgi:putative aminopeptidase FrvX